MTTLNLIRWIALLGGFEAMLQGHLANHAALFQLGSVGLIVGLVWTSTRWRHARAAALGLLGLAAFTLGFAAIESLRATPAETQIVDPLTALWKPAERERTVLDEGNANAELRVVRLFGRTIPLAQGGWRAKEDRPREGFRIVATGGSTTFGATRESNALSWPRLLEGLIQRELHCAMPVQVVNAGVLGRGIQGTLASLEDSLTQLEPDLVLHLPDTGDLAAVVRSVPELALAPAEPLPARFSQFARQFEASWRSGSSSRAFIQATTTDRSELDLRESPLGQSYRKLVLESRKRGIDVAFIPIALAVNIHSSEASLRRFEALEYRARRFALARPIHERLLRQVAAVYRAPVLDAVSNLDGTGDLSFIHLATFSEAGRAQLARNAFENLRERLARAPTNCTPKGMARVESRPQR